MWAIAMPVMLVLHSCIGSVTKPSRSKMPDLAISGQSFEGDGFSIGSPLSGNPETEGFAPEEIKLTASDGREQNFVRIALPTKAMDSVAIGMLKTLKPYAAPLLRVWLGAHNNSGVLLDLSSGRGTIYQAGYCLQGESGLNIPVIIRWDRESANRAVLAQSLATGVPSLSLKQLSGDMPGKISAIEQ